MIRRTPFQINRAVVFALLLREMRSRFGQRRMGAFWMLAEPIIQLIFMVIIMGFVRGRGPTQGIPFPVFLLTGIAPFIMFRGIAMLIMEGLSANRGLFAYKQVQPIDTFIARTIMQVSIASISYLAVLAAFGWYGYDVGVYRPLEWLGLLCVGVALSFGMGMVFAVLVDAIPESRTLMRFLFLGLYFSSGAMFPVTSFPSYVLPYISWNPYLHLIELLRESVFPFYKTLALVSFSYVATCTAVCLAVGLGLFRVRKTKMLAIKGIT
jgi:capsular polysaccharide transport system permease protein